MLTRQQIKEISREQIEKNTGMTIGGFLISIFVPIAAAAIGFGIGGYIVQSVMQIGYAAFCISIFVGKQTTAGDIFNKGFDKNFGRKLGGMLFKDLFIFLWSLLFIIPGIIKSYSYFMVPYILANDEDIKATQATRMSIIMMKGHKWQTFVMYLSFFGWNILTAITAGIVGYLYAGRYQATALAGLAMEIREEAIRNNIVKIDETGHLAF